MRYGRFLTTQLGICFVNDDEGGQGAQGGGGNNENNQQQQKDPPWKSEFGDNFDPDKAWETIQKQRRDERATKRRLEELEAKTKERDDAEKSEVEKLNTRLKELETENTQLKTTQRENALRTKVAEVASAAGAIVPEDIYELVSRKLEVDDDGEITNLKKVIDNLKETRPAYFSGSNIDANAGERRNQQNQNDMNSLLRAGR